MLSFSALLNAERILFSSISFLQYDASIPQLQAVLHDAEALTSEEAIVGSSGSAAPGGAEAAYGTIHTHAGLRQAIDLFTYLARLLPENDVRWRVERRLLGGEPFVDFGRSDVRARAILLHSGYLELLATMHRRQLPTDDAAAAVARALATTATDMVAALPLLNAILANETLPSEDMQVGSWSYDATARSRRLIDLFSELSEVYASLMQLLVFGLQQATALCRVLGTNAAALLMPGLVDALLAPEQKLPREVKRAALALVCAVLAAVSPQHHEDAGLELTAVERSARERSRVALCSLLDAKVVPALETMVQQDYRMWGEQHASRTSGASNSAPGADPEQHPAEHVGAEKVEALGQCYAFLVCCGRVGWAGIEAKATQPFSFSLFWRQANATYRHFAIFLLAHALHHAPAALGAQAHASVAMRLWLQAITDTGRRHCAWYLTRVLAANPATAPLFDGLNEAALDIRRDASGQLRAALAGAVGGKIMSSSVWRPQLVAVVGELDVLLAARRKEIEATAFNAEAAVLKWEGATSSIILAFLHSVAPALGPPPTRNAPRDLAAASLRKLLTRAALWALNSCTALHLDHCRALRGTGDSSGAAENNDPGLVDEGIEQLRTVAEARQRLKDTPFASLPALFDILLAVGAPEALDADPELVDPMWLVVAGCLELGSGEVVPTPVDVAMFESLAAALVPSPPSQEQPPGPVQASRRVPLPPDHHKLCSYVLATIVRRALHRSSLRHISNERAAVNALRLAMAVLEQPSMRSIPALQAALATLLWPLLAVLNPDNNGPASYGAKAVVFE